MKPAAAVPPELEAALAMAAGAAAGAEDPWWIIGSAALALHGVAVEVRDVDLLMSARDARRLLAGLAIAPAPGSRSRRFRSEVFGTWRAPPVPIEVMGGFSLAGADGWSPVALVSREPVAFPGGTVFIPAAAELRALLLRFARPKDLARAALLPG